MSLDDYDLDSVFTIIVIVLFLVAAIIALFMLAHHNAIEEYRVDCESNPRLRYAINCTTIKDCTSKCMEKLYNDDKK